MAAAAAAAPAQPKSNVGHYMKSAMFSMISVSIATTIAGWISGQEEFIPCGMHVNDNSWIGDRYQSLRYFDPKNTHHETQYVAVRDGAELAVDTYLADYMWDHKEKVATVVHYTRHGRGYTLDFPFSLFTQYKQSFTNPRTNAYVQRFVSNGYAWVSVEVRGSGVSGGSKTHDFADQEVQDAYDVIDWITKQPWSNGEVAAFGHGIEGVGAMLMAASGHPALKAVSLNGAPVDVYASAFFPGGVRNRNAIADFSGFTQATDSQQRWDSIPALKARLMMKYFGGNVYAVDGDKQKLQRHVAEHKKNPNLAKELDQVTFRDDKLPSVGVSASELDAIRHLGKIAASGVAIHAFGGYYDMGVARSTILLYQYLTNTLDKDTASLLPPLPESADTNPYRHRLSLGPWSHSGVDNADPFARSKQKCFWHLDEISRFFDHHMYPNRREIASVEEEEPIHYFTLVHNRWKTSVTWPPSYLHDQVFQLGLNQSLQEVNTPEGQETLDLGVKNKMSGIVSRWDAFKHSFGLRPDYSHERTPLDAQYITFLTPQLPLVEITGEVELRVFFSVDRPNVNLVAYLEDVDHTMAFKNENKRPGVTYITEALLNPVHTPVRPESSVYSFLKKDSREIEAGKVYEAVLKFEPISYAVKRNHQLRLSIGAAPREEFGDAGAAKLTIHFGGDYPSSLKIPTFEGVHMTNVVPPEEAPVQPAVEQPKRVEEEVETESGEEDEFAVDEEANKDEL
ncbi:hypothetical protein PINS_up012461 [Pythium insidiosum]|nr:hypothetical protein PINS_up012461 [Pythium insidiosum]